MSTTALAVELLVIGYQTLVWLALAVCFSSLCDNTLMQAIKAEKELAAVASVVVAYTLGAMMNVIATRLMAPLENKLYSKLPKKPSEMRAAILIQKPEALNHVMKYFEVPRVLRSTFFNILFIGILSFVHVISSNATRSQLLLVALFTLGTASFILWAWYEAVDNYRIHLSATYDALKNLGTKS